MAKNTSNTSSNSTKGTTSNKKETFLQALKLNLGNITEACKASNVPRRTYYNWKESYELFKEECDNVPEELLDLAEHSLLSEIQDKTTKNHITAVIFFLKTKGKKRGYSESMQLEVKPISEIKFDGI